MLRLCALLAAAVVILGCGRHSLEDVENRVGERLAEEVTCVETQRARTWMCEGASGETYEARISRNGERLAVRPASDGSEWGE